MTRIKRNPGESRTLDPKFQAFLQQIRSNSPDIGECEGRVLKLKPSVSSNARPEEINMVLDALKQVWPASPIRVYSACMLSHFRCNAFAFYCATMKVRFNSASASDTDIALVGVQNWRVEVLYIQNFELVRPLSCFCHHVRCPMQCSIEHASLVQLAAVFSEARTAELCVLTRRTQASTTFQLKLSIRLSRACWTSSWHA